MDDDWDLHAVVRGCCTATTATSSSNAYVHGDIRPSCSSTNTNSPSSGPLNINKLDVHQLPDLFKHLFHNPFFPPKSQQPLILHSSASLVSPPTPTFQGRFHLKRPHSKPSLATNSTSTSQPPRSKKRKKQLKKVCQVPAESVSSDVWAWRKYGQKPIKGSPYPRGYYRCSSSKGCLARKQVERNRSDPGMFIVTYTGGDHNHPAPTHRNSLSGSTRLINPGQSSAQPTTSNPPLPPPSSSSPEEEAMPQSTSRGEQYDSSLEDDGGDDGEVDLSRMALNDDFFVGLEELIHDDDGGDSSDRFPANFGLSWNNACTTSTPTATGCS